MKDNVCWFMLHVSALILPPALAFVKPLGALNSGCTPEHDVHHQRLTKLSVAPTETPDGSRLPPKDGSFGIRGTIKELLAAPQPPVGGDKRYDEIGLETGGIWRTKALGILPSTVVAAPKSTKWVVKQEAAGTIVADWPSSVVQILGPKSLNNLGSQPEGHASVRKMYAEAFSSKAVLNLKPIVEDALDKRITKFEEFASSGEEILMFEEISRFTLEIIMCCLFGDYASDEILEEVITLMPALSKGLFSVPRAVPWPLSMVPLFKFGTSLKARRKFKGRVDRVLKERRKDLKSSADGSGVARSAGVLDKFLRVQKEQVGGGGAKDGELELDDDFIFDNVVVSFFAGFETTATMLARVVEALKYDGFKELKDKLIQELCQEITTGSDNVDEELVSSAGKSTAGLFGNFPLLDAIVLETFRVYPAVPAVFRKALNDIEYNGYLIPAGETVNWNLVQGFGAESIYPEPEKLCPFRFLHGDKPKSQDSAAVLTDSAASASKEQPRPLMFGFGKHTCPGRELAKLEILTFLKAFLVKFDYDIVEGQNLGGTLPTNAPKDKLRLVLRLKA